MWTKQAKKRSVKKAAAFSLAAFLAAGTLLSGCAKPVVEGMGKSTGHLSDLTLSQPDTGFSQKSNAFGLALLKKQYNKENNADVFLSPASLTLALGMVAQGAQGETLQQLMSLFDMDADELEAFSASCRDMQSLMTANPKKYFSLANAIWIDKNAEPAVSPAFLEKNDNYFGALVAAEPFDDTLLPKMNKWISDNTDGMLTKLMEPPLPEDVFMLLGNTLLFDGKWEMAFKMDQTKEDTFHGQKADITLPMMHRTDDDNGLYYHGDGVSAALLPYQDDRTAMLVALPDGELSELVDTLTAERVDSWMEKMHACDLKLTMPRFSMEYTAELADSLKAMGAELPFDADKADFRSMANLKGNIYLTSVLHGTRLVVNENGTKAAAFTFVMPGAKSAKPEITELILDRPFLCAIVDKPTGALHFVGTVSNPQKLA